jgi:predicted chitinase
MSLYKYIQLYQPTKNQTLAANELIANLPKDILKTFTEYWKGSSKIKGSSVFYHLKNKNLETHQSQALSFLDAYFINRGKDAWQQFLKDYCTEDTSEFTITYPQFVEISRVTIDNYGLTNLNNSLNLLQNVSPLVICHFLAQVLHESGGLKYSKELASGQAYEYRKDLGNTENGDGKKYKGAGGIQLTGKYNYKQFSDWIDDYRVMEGVDYVAKHHFWTSAVWYWNSRNLSKWALKDDIRGVTLRVNGGYNGLADREFYLARAKKVLM